MNITQFDSLLKDDLSIVTDGAESVQLYNPDSASTITIQNCISGKILQKKSPSESPEGVTVFERCWNIPSKYNGIEHSVNINDVVIDSNNNQWKVISIEQSKLLGRTILSTQRIDNSSRLDAWVDIVTPIYETDDYGATYIARYQEDVTGVGVRIIHVPISSHRELTTVPEDRIEIAICEDSIQIVSQQRIRLSDGTIYKPTDLFPVTQTCPCLRIIAQKEEL